MIHTTNPLKNASKIHKDHSPIQLYILSSFLPSHPFFYLSHPKPRYNIPYRIPNPPTASQKKAIATSLGIVPILPSQKNKPYNVQKFKSKNKINIANAIHTHTYTVPISMTILYHSHRNALGIVPIEKVCNNKKYEEVKL